MAANKAHGNGKSRRITEVTRRQAKASSNKILGVLFFIPSMTPRSKSKVIDYRSDFRTMRLFELHFYDKVSIQRFFSKSISPINVSLYSNGLFFFNHVVKNARFFAKYFFVSFNNNYCHKEKVIAMAELFSCCSWERKAGEEKRQFWELFVIHSERSENINEAKYIFHCTVVGTLE